MEGEKESRSAIRRRRTLWRIRNKISNQKPTWIIEILYSSNVIFVLGFTFF